MGVYKGTNTAWEKVYRKGELLKRDPHPDIGRIADVFEKERVKRILNLGCGGGRHLVYLARRGFDVYGLDSAPTGLVYTLCVLAKEGLTAHFALHDMSNLPYDNDYFDAVISIQVIHHNDLEGVKRTIGEIRRVVKREGLTWITMPVSKNEPSTKQKEIDPGTFLPLNGREKGLPHHYFKMEEIPALFSGFSIIDLHTDSTNHFSLLAREVSK